MSLSTGRSGVSSRTRSQKRNRSAQSSHHCRAVSIVNGAQQCHGYPEMKEFVTSDQGEKCCPPEHLDNKQDVSDLLDYLSTLTSTSDLSVKEYERSLGLWLSAEIVLDDNGQPTIQPLDPSEMESDDPEDLPQYAIEYDSSTDSFSIQEYGALAVYRYPRATSTQAIGELIGLQFTFDQVLNVLDDALQHDLVNALILWTPMFHIDYLEGDNYVGRFEVEDPNSY